MSLPRSLSHAQEEALKLCPSELAEKRVWSKSLTVLLDLALESNDEKLLREVAREAIRAVSALEAMHESTSEILKAAVSK